MEKTELGADYSQFFIVGNLQDFFHRLKFENKADGQLISEGDIFFLKITANRTLLISPHNKWLVQQKAKTRCRNLSLKWFLNMIKSDQNTRLLQCWGTSNLGNSACHSTSKCLSRRRPLDEDQQRRGGMFCCSRATRFCDDGECDFWKAGNNHLMTCSHQMTL